MRRSIVLLSTSLTLAMIAPGASGRSTILDLDAQAAASSALGTERLLDVPYFLKGQAHSAIAQDLGVFRSNQRTNAFNKSDEAACQIAFLSAVIQFQKRAQSLGGDAVVDLTSITADKPLDSATQYRCAAGNIVANVALTGRVVKLKK